ncbi:filamentous hemagglutinin N-terminal domain-containing protein [Nostoc sp. UCD120]|nr:filamentous hemagglutinin N-terminal domain-containing protein [Nostoc sp. UCD120]
MPVNAQIIPDKTLPINSNVEYEGNTNRIEGGTIKGSNLFHSFEQFSVLTGNEAYFNNNINIQNIITRITGKSISNIDGILKANGTANLFLLNPNGIIFGNNAKLNIGGSFLATTANQINFADDTKFSTNNPQPNPLLTVSVPIGLQIDSNPGTIRIQGTGHNLIGPPFSPLITSSSAANLQVQPERTIAIVGGDVILEGGVITARGGRIELGSLSNGSVSINPTTSGWKLGYENVPYFQDINLSKRALVNTSGIGSGSIQIEGRRVTLTDGSVILNQNQGTLPGGTLNVNASESLSVSGSDPIARTAGGLRSETLGFGKAGDIAISSKQVIIKNGGQINNLTFGAATSGDISINASNSVQLIGISPLNPGVFSTISTATFNSGNTGDIRVSTGRFTAIDGSSLSSSSFGTGRGGDVTVSATDLVEIIGASQITSQPSILSSTSLNAGKAGSLIIDTSRLVVHDGGRVDASTYASGEGGSVTINANSVEVSGTIPGSEEPSLVNASANIVTPTLQELFRLPPVPSGKSGDVTINIEQLSVTEDAQVSVRNDGLGDAGKLEINANQINITNNGGITATSAVGQGGEIGINSNVLQLRGGTISATAGQQGTNGDGGDININTNILAASKNSSITANAFEGRGGNIQINARGLFLSPDSFITTRSQLGVDGTVQINGFNVNPAGIKAAPEIVTKTPNMVLGCAAQSGTGSDMLIVASNSPPPKFDEHLDSQPIWHKNSISSKSDEVSSKLQLSTIKETTEIVEAQSWIIDSRGNVELVAIAPNQAAPDNFFSTIPCTSVDSVAEFSHSRNIVKQ